MNWTEVETGWYQNHEIGSVRNAKSWKPGGWWFFPAWLPDDAENDQGPFKTMREAIDHAEAQARDRKQAGGDPND